MPYDHAFEAVFVLERRLNAAWRHIHAAKDATLRQHAELEEVAGMRARADASLVVLGSGGRFEVTSGSDVDWTYLIDGQADAEHQSTALDLRDLLAKGKEPGREGVFGVMAFSHDIVQYVGGEDDSNSNLTRRILLLLESKSIGRSDAYVRVLRATLDQYLTNDHGWQHGTTHGIPRYLLNDIARYWHTVAVDYAYKRRSRRNEGWALRSAKLRMSRKLTYAAGLLYCFSLSDKLWSTAPALEDSSRRPRAIERLEQLTNSTPLDLLAAAFNQFPVLDARALVTFDCYNRFLEMMDSGEVRKALKELPPESASTDALYAEVRDLGRKFQDGLTELFIDNQTTPYRALTREFGVF